MKIKNLSVLLFLLLATVLFAANKIDFQLREMLDDEKLAKAGMVDVIVQVASQDFSSIEEFGGHVRTTAGSYATASIPSLSIQALANEEDVIYLAGSSKLKLLNDRATIAIGINQAVENGYSGSDVLLGIIDSGIDIDHYAFRNQNGETRILYLWDQTVTNGAFSERYDYGVEWSSKSINNDACTTTDIDGHGTHIAGCAAQFFYDGGESKYNGAETESNLIIVKTDMTGSHIVDAISYIIEKASELDRPAVINISLGSQLGPHDGTDPETAFTDFLGEQAIIVRAAGNDGDNNIHEMVQSTPSGSTMSFTTQSASYLSFDCWYDGSTQAEMNIWLPDGSIYGPIAYGQQGTISHGNLEIEIQNSPYGAEYFNDDNRIIVKMSGGIPAGSYKFEFITPATTTVHSWMYDSDPYAEFAFDSNDNHYTLANEACGKNVLVVGAAVTTNEFAGENQSGQVGNYYSGEELASVASFSSGGPTRDGRQKPDIVMPGSMIAAAMSGDADLHATQAVYNKIDPSGSIQWYVPGMRTMGIGCGTSQAAGQASRAVPPVLDWIRKKTNLWAGVHAVVDFFKTISQPTINIKDHLNKPGTVQSEWDYRSGWGYVDLRALMSSDIVSGECQQVESAMISLQYSGAIPNAASGSVYSISGYSNASIKSVNLKGNTINLELDQPLIEGYRDTLVIHSNYAGQKEFPVQKFGTIVDIPSLISSTSWTSEKSPYYVHNELYIDSQTILTIEAGTRIKFIPNSDASAGLQVVGGLVINGTFDEPVILEPYNSTQRGVWQGIGIYQSEKKSVINNAFIDYAHAGVIVAESELEMNNVFISHSHWQGIFAQDCSPVIRYTVIWDTQGGSDAASGIYLKNTGQNTIIQNVTCYENHYAGIAIDGGESTEISKSIVAKNYVGIYNPDEKPADVSNCDVWANDFNYHKIISQSQCFSQNPLFVDPASGNFHLQADSPCLGIAGAFIGGLPQTHVKNESVAANDFILKQNYPNPFNGSTIIEFALPERERVSLSIYNVLGNKVRTLYDRTSNAGFYKVNWDGCNEQGIHLANGIYFYRLTAGTFQQTNRMILMQ